MKLDRNVNTDGMGRYALIRLREITKAQLKKLVTFARKEKFLAALDFGEGDKQVKGARSGKDRPDFFVVKLDDEFAADALSAYAESVNARAAESDRWLALVQPCGCRLRVVDKTDEHPETAEWGAKCKQDNCVRIVGQVEPAYAGPMVELREFAKQINALSEKADKLYRNGKSHQPKALK